MVKAPARFNPLKETTRERAHERARLVLSSWPSRAGSPKERRQAEQAGIRPGLLPEFKIQPQAFTEWVVQTGDQYVKRARRSGSSSPWSLASSTWRSSILQACQGGGRPARVRCRRSDDGPMDGCGRWLALSTGHSDSSTTP